MPQTGMAYNMPRQRMQEQLTNVISFPGQKQITPNGMRTYF